MWYSILYYHISNILSTVLRIFLQLFPFVLAAQPLQIVVDQSKTLIQNDTVFLGQTRTSLLENAVDSFGDVFSHLASLFGQCQRALIALLHATVAHKIAVFLQVFDGAGDVCLVLLAHVAQLAGSQRLGFMQIIQAGNMGAFEVKSRHFLGLDLADAAIDACNQHSKGFKTMFHFCHAFLGAARSCFCAKSVVFLL